MPGEIHDSDSGGRRGSVGLGEQHKTLLRESEVMRACGFKVNHSENKPIDWRESVELVTYGRGLGWMKLTALRVAPCTWINGYHIE